MFQEYSVASDEKSKHYGRNGLMSIRKRYNGNNAIIKIVNNLTPRIPTLKFQMKDVGCHLLYLTFTQWV